MAAVTLDSLLEPVSDAEPSGPNLEFDPDFGALNRAAEGKPERQSGSAVIPAEDPDWREVETQAGDLLQRTRDLRALVHLGTARLHRAGLPAYAGVLATIHALLAAQWATIHPQLDPEDDNDPTARKNVLENLVHPRLVLRHLRQLPVTTARTGRYTWRDLAIATGKLLPEGNEAKPSVDAVRGAFNDSDPAELTALRDACTETLAAIKGIDAVFLEQAGPGVGPDFKDLPKIVRDIAEFVDTYRPAAGAEAVPDAGQDAAASAADQPGPAAAARPAAVTSAMVTEVTTRAEATRLLGLISQYYRRHEPSSPLPMLLDRALRLADKNFLDILRDMAPDGLMQAQNVVGAQDE